MQSEKVHKVRVGNHVGSTKMIQNLNNFGNNHVDLFIIAEVRTNVSEIVQKGQIQEEKVEIRPSSTLFMIISLQKDILHRRQGKAINAASAFQISFRWRNQSLQMMTEGEVVQARHGLKRRNGLLATGVTIGDETKGPRKNAKDILVRVFGRP